LAVWRRENRSFGTLKGWRIRPGQRSSRLRRVKAWRPVAPANRRLGMPGTVADGAKAGASGRKIGYAGENRGGVDSVVRRGGDGLARSANGYGRFGELLGPPGNQSRVRR
jgi:hypothetical protein